jgi:hypothetical protein
MNLVTIIGIIKVLLQLVSFLMQKADEKQLKELGKDELVQQQLVDMLHRTGLAKQISEDVDKLTDDAVDKQLSDFYRD